MFHVKSMPSKSAKKRTKAGSKKVKNTLRKHLAEKRRTKSLSNPSSAPNADTTLATTAGNSLRNQLLARAALNPYGFNAQQYGNITNERRINELRNNNNFMTQRISDDKAIIDSMTQEKTKLEGEVKSLKKKKKEAKADLAKAQNDLGVVTDELDEAKRIEAESNRQKNRMQQKQLELEEYNRKNDIVKFKTEADSLEAQVHQKKLQNEQLQKSYEANREYQSMLKLREELKYETNKNAGLLAAMKDPSFADPNKEAIELQRQLEIEKHRSFLLEEKRKKDEELQRIRLMNRTLNVDDMNEIMGAVSKEIAATEQKIIQERLDLYPKQKTVNEYEATLAKREDLDKQLYELQQEREALQAKSEKMTDQNRKALNTYNKAKLGSIAQQQINNATLQRRIDLSKRREELKEEGYIKDTVAAALANSTSPEVENLLKENAALEIANESMNERINATKLNRKAMFDRSRLEAQQKFMDSEEMNEMSQNIARLQDEAYKMQKENEQLDLLNKTEEERKKALLVYEYKAKAIDQDLPLVQQVQAAAELHDDLIGKMNRKLPVIEEILAIKRQYPARWQEFISLNPGAVSPTKEAMMNRPIGELQGILSGFKGYLDKTPPDGINDTSSIEERAMETHLDPNLANIQQPE